MTPDNYTKAMKLRGQMFPLLKRSKETHDRILVKLLEEAGELAGSCNTFFGRKYRPELVTGNVDNIKGEIGDLFFVLLGLCEFWETTPDEVLEIVIQKLQERKEQSEVLMRENGAN